MTANYALERTVIHQLLSRQACPKHCARLARLTRVRPAAQRGR